MSTDLSQVPAIARPPAFRFVYPHPDLSGCRARIAPWGYTSDGVERLTDPDWHGVVGEIEATGPDTATVRFARVDGPRLFAGAVDQLRRWAAADGWELTFEEGIEPLRDPAPAPSPRPGEGECTRCGEIWSTGTSCHIGFATRGWEPSRCSACGWRLRWWEPAG